MFYAATYVIKQRSQTHSQQPHVARAIIKTTQIIDKTMFFLYYKGTFSLQLWPAETFFLLMWPVNPSFVIMWPAYETEFETPVIKQLHFLQFFTCKRYDVIAVKKKVLLTSDR